MLQDFLNKKLTPQEKKTVGKILVRAKVNLIHPQLGNLTGIILGSEKPFAVVHCEKYNIQWEFAWETLVRCVCEEKSLKV